MNVPLVSVIIPVRNFERYIAEAIESVLTQEFQDWELIIVDDCSTDRTNEIAARYQDGEKIRLVRNERNLGQFPAHNRGAALARGKYLKFFHGDDVMYPHCLGTMVRCMEAFPRAALGISHPRRLWAAPHLFSPEEAWRAQTARQTSILSEGPSGTIFRAEAFRQVGGFGSRFYTGDSEMNFRMALNHFILLLPDGLW
jgi:glycosyltransferase involved in cell wall biosynthesis